VAVLGIDFGHDQEVIREPAAAVDAESDALLAAPRRVPAPFGVRVNALAPGYIKTDMSPVDDPQYHQHWIADAPQQRYTTPDELGPAIVYLASDASSFVTGSVLMIDGGYTVF
jgi:NAD(P)-dependent dehydrogenase (short-subunit alcohol dehydrogenase family)